MLLASFVEKFSCETRFLCLLHVQIGREQNSRDGNDYGEVKCTRVSSRVEKVNRVYDAAREIRVPFAKRS